MRFAHRLCPKCKTLAKGTVELIQCVALLNFDEAGNAEYAGESDMAWDTQETMTDRTGRVKLTCDNGHDWFSELLP